MTIDTNKLPDLPSTPVLAMATDKTPTLAQLAVAQEDPHGICHGLNRDAPAESNAWIDAEDMWNYRARGLGVDHA